MNFEHFTGKLAAGDDHRSLTNDKSWIVTSFQFQAIVFGSLLQLLVHQGIEYLQHGFTDRDRMRNQGRLLKQTAKALGDVSLAGSCMAI